jgi:hypothetical protein
MQNIHQDRDGQTDKVKYQSKFMTDKFLHWKAKGFIFEILQV